MSGLKQQRLELLSRLREYGSCVVAMSAGVDSAVVAKAAYEALGDRALAVTAASASLAAGELAQATELARQIGIRHHVVQTAEFQQEEYLRNDLNRCYHCKAELYNQLGDLAQRFSVAVTVNGANADDLGDYRPGMIAAQEFHVQSPLAECGLGKDDVRRLAAYWDLPVWDKPATPCLSSRVAYGERVTPQRLAMIDQAEQYLRSLGLRDVRVRYHRGDLARVEVPVEALSRLCEPERRRALAEKLRAIGFKYVTLDIEGFCSGSLNRLISLEVPGKL